MCKVAPRLCNRIAAARARFGQRRNKEVRLVVERPAGVGKSCLAIAAASYLFERRWFPEGCVRVEMGECSTESEALAALTEALDMDLSTLSDITKALKHWRGLLVLDKCDAARASSRCRSCWPSSSRPGTCASCARAAAQRTGRRSRDQTARSAARRGCFGSWRWRRRPASFGSRRRR